MLAKEVYMSILEENKEAVGPQLKLGLTKESPLTQESPIRATLV